MEHCSSLGAPVYLSQSTVVERLVCKHFCFISFCYIDAFVVNRLNLNANTKASGNYKILNRMKINNVNKEIPSSFFNIIAFTLAYLIIFVTRGSAF